MSAKDTAGVLTEDESIASILSTDFDEFIEILGSNCGMEDEMSIVCNEVSGIYFTFYPGLGFRYSMTLRVPG